MKISGSHQQQCFTHASPPRYGVQTDDKPIYEKKKKKVKHLPERVKQQCNPFPLCYARLYTSSAICRCISLLFHHCLKLQNKQKTVKFSLFLDIHYTQYVNSRGRVAVLIQQFLMSNISCWELNSKYLFGIKISIKTYHQLFQIFPGLWWSHTTRPKTKYSRVMSEEQSDVTTESHLYVFTNTIPPQNTEVLSKGTGRYLANVCSFSRRFSTFSYL